MTSESIIYNILDELPSYRAKGEESNTYKFMNGFALELEAFTIEEMRMVNEIHISTATGSYLNDIGKFYELVRREGETDEQFRARIMAEFNLNVGSGTQEAIKDVFEFTLNTSETAITLVEVEPLKVGVVLTLTTSQITLIPILRELANKAKAGGVHIFIGIGFVPPTPINSGFIADISYLDGPDLV